MEQLISTFIEDVIDAIINHSDSPYEDMSSSMESLRMFTTSSFKEFDYKGFRTAVREIKHKHVNDCSYHSLDKDINSLFFPLLQEVEAHFTENCYELN